MKPKEYKRPGVNKPNNIDQFHNIGVLHHSIDREIDNDSIWFVEINGRSRIPLTLDKWEQMKAESKIELNGVVILRFVDKSGRNVERFKT